MPRLNDAPYSRSHGFVLTLALGAAGLVGACDKKTDDAAKTETAGSPATPAAAPADQIAVSDDNIYFKSADGTVNSWGGVLEDGNEETREKRAAVAELANTKRFGVGGEGKTMCVVMNDGTAKCWGNGHSGQLGDGKEGESAKPVVVPGVSNAEAIALAGSYLCALIGDGTVQCWGDNAFNQVSVDENKKTLVTPTAVPGVTDAQQIACGNETSCALGKDGSVKCWGLDCGAAGPNFCTKPYTVESLAGATHIAAGWQSMCVVMKDATVQCWGDNDEGQLGNGTKDAPPTGTIGQVKGLSGVSELAAGQMHWCALMKDGTVQCWGSNEYGQLGDGTLPEGDKNAFRATAAPVKGLSDAISLACSGGTCCAQVKDKSVKCWGENGGMFGSAHAEAQNVATPVAVPVN